MLCDVVVSVFMMIGVFVWVKVFDVFVDCGVFVLMMLRKLVYVMSGMFFACTWSLFSASGAARFFVVVILLV